MQYKTYLLNSLDTVFYDSDIHKNTLESIEIFENEAASFQLAFKPDFAVGEENNWWDGAVEIKIEIESDISDSISLYAVENVPATRIGYSTSDDWFLRKTPGIYPDRLSSHPKNYFSAVTGAWKSFWININEKLDTLTPNDYSITIKLYNRKTEELVSENTVNFSVVKGLLPKQKIITTNWIHYDCISYFSNTEPFSEEFYEVAKKYIRMATANGQNMIFLPAFTPPLDTPVGEERQTTQLVDVTLTNGKYAFDFTRMKHFIELCLECGAQYFEHNHMYTQWGAEHAPKIIATVDGVEKKIFGWETDVHADEYHAFLHEYLTALKAFLDENGYKERFFFHVSDEPTDKYIESYKKASEFMHKELEGYPSGDALWEYKFYEQGLVHTPIPVTNHADDFIGRAKPLWLYYTGIESVDFLSNRLIGMSQERGRILGMQLYYTDADGFLHWAFNAHQNRLSRKNIDPAISTDMDGDFVSGASYLVYPNVNDPEPSVRLMTFRDQMQDTRALLMLEGFIGRDAVCELIKKHIPDISLKCRITQRQLLDLRNEVNSLIKDFVNK